MSYAILKESIKISGVSYGHENSSFRFYISSNYIYLFTGENRVINPRCGDYNHYWNVVTKEVSGSISSFMREFPASGR